jgi:hypothetical protein
MRRRVTSSVRVLGLATLVTLVGCSSQKPKPAEPTGVANAKIYSCFTFATKASTGSTPAKQNACMRTVECEEYRSQVITTDGVADIGECAAVDALFCFHHAKTDKIPDGADVCQPSVAECQTARSEAAAAGTPVDSECAPR